MNSYRQTALDNLGEAYAPLLDAIAERLHHNESSHLHDLTADVDSYCWMRAEHALVALRENNSLHVVDAAAPEPQPTAAVPYGWALWRLDGVLYECVRVDQVPGVTDGWEAVFAHYPDVDPRSFQGWMIDPINEADYQVLSSHHTSFGYPGSRNEFLTETRAENDRRAQGLPPVAGYAAWGPSGELIALQIAVRGLNGWHALGIGDHAADVTLDVLDVDEYEHLENLGSLYRGPGGRGYFHNWLRDEAASNEPPDTGSSPLAHAFTEALIAHGPKHDNDLPENLRAQFLVGCLAAMDAAMDDWWAEQNS